MMSTNLQSLPTVLLEAIERKSSTIKALVKLVGKQGDLNIRHPQDGMSFLSKAILTRDEQIIQIVFDGIKKHEENITVHLTQLDNNKKNALWYAAQQGFSEIVKKMLASPREERNKDIDIDKYTWFFADTEATSCLHAAAELGHAQVIQAFINDLQANTEDSALLKKMLHQQNKYGDTPLHLAIRKAQAILSEDTAANVKEYIFTITALISAGADINVKNDQNTSSWGELIKNPILLPSIISNLNDQILKRTLIDKFKKQFELETSVSNTTPERIAMLKNIQTKITNLFSLREALITFSTNNPSLFPRAQALVPDVFLPTEISTTVSASSTLTLDYNPRRTAFNKKLIEAGENILARFEQGPDTVYSRCATIRSASLFLYTATSLGTLGYSAFVLNKDKDYVEACPYYAECDDSTAEKNDTADNGVIGVLISGVALLAEIPYLYYSAYRDPKKIFSLNFWTHVSNRTNATTWAALSESIHLIQPQPVPQQPAFNQACARLDVEFISLQRARTKAQAKEQWEVVKAILIEIRDQYLEHCTPELFAETTSNVVIAINEDPAGGERQPLLRR